MEGTFTCPKCSEQMDLDAYLTHASTGCGGKSKTMPSSVSTDSPDDKATPTQQRYQTSTAIPKSGPRQSSSQSSNSPTDLFPCPICSIRLTMAEYPDHAAHCQNLQVSNDRGDNGGNTNCPAPIQQDPPPVQKFQCPICNISLSVSEYASHAATCQCQNLRMGGNERSGDGNSRQLEKRQIEIGTNNDEAAAKRNRILGRNEDYVRQPLVQRPSTHEIHIEAAFTEKRLPSGNSAQNSTAMNRGTQQFQQAPTAVVMPAENMNPHATPPALGTNLNVTSTIPSMNAYQQQAQQQQHMMRSGGGTPREPQINHVPTTPVTQHRFTPHIVASAYQPQFTSSMHSGTPQQPIATSASLGMTNLFQTPTGPSSIQRPATTFARVPVKEEVPEIINSSICSQNGGFPNNNALADIIVGRLAARIRQQDNRFERGLNEIRQRLEIFEASMMMKLSTIEGAIVRLKEEQQKGDGQE